MPIRFRCPYCNKLLGIARRKAGTDTVCPHCGSAITVPHLDDPQRNEVGDQATPPAPIPLPPTPSLAPVLPAEANPEPRAAAAANPQPPAQAPDGERPLFERDVDELLGAAGKPPPPPGEQPKPRPTSGMDAASFGKATEPALLNSHKVTVVVVGVVLLLACAFAAGFLIATR